MLTESIIARKSLGVLMHPTCIPGGRECGTFGRGAKEWIKKLHKHRIEYWQFLPLTPTDSTGSPYSSPSSFALNPWFLDCLLYTSPSPRDKTVSRMPSSA